MSNSNFEGFGNILNPQNRPQHDLLDPPLAELPQNRGMKKLRYAIQKSTKIKLE